MASPDARPAPDAVSDRAALLRYVLDHVLQRCSLPDGVSNVKDLNLAQIDVPSLLASLREPLGRPDLRGATLGESWDTTQSGADTQPVVSLENPPTRTNPTPFSVNTPDEDGVPPVVSFASLGLDVPVLSINASSASALSRNGSNGSHAPTPKRSLSLVSQLPVRNSNGAAPDANAHHDATSPDVHAGGIAAPIPELILPPLRGGGPFGNGGGVGGDSVRALNTKDTSADSAIALCAFEVLVASLGDAAHPSVDVARTALELAPAVAQASVALLAPHLKDAHAETKAGTTARVHLRLLAEASGCGSQNASGSTTAFGGDSPTAERARVAFVRRQLACLTETLWAAHDSGSIADTSVGQHTSGADTSHDGFDDEDGASVTPSVGAVIEEVNRLANNALSDSALFTTETCAVTKREIQKLNEHALSRTVEAVVEMVETSLDAVDATNSATQGSAWQYPPALAGRAYAQLTKGVFDPLDESALADDLDETICALSGSGGAGEALGIGRTARDAIFAWTLARRYREVSVGDGAFTGSYSTDDADKKQSLASRAYARALEAETRNEDDDDDDDDDGMVGSKHTKSSANSAYALLATAKSVLSAPHFDRKQVAPSITSGNGMNSPDKTRVDDASLTLTHAALGPLVWWTEGALCDFFKDVDVCAVELLRRLPKGPSVNGVVPRKEKSNPSMTLAGFEAVLSLGVAAATARARVAAAVSPGFDEAMIDECGADAGACLAARCCAGAAEEAYFALRGDAEEHDFETWKARHGGVLVGGGSSVVDGESFVETRNGESLHKSNDQQMDIAPGLAVLADGCACLADAFEAHLAAFVVAVAGPASANAAPAALASAFGEDLCKWLATVPPLDAGARRALAGAKNFQNAVAAAIGDRAGGQVGRAGDGVDIVHKVDKSFREFGQGTFSGGADKRSVTTDNRCVTKFEPFRLELRIAPMVFNWIAGRIDVTRRTMRRSLSAESWRGMSGLSNTADFGVAFSAVELVRSAWDTLEAFWQLQVPAPVSSMRALTEGLDGAFQEYAEFVTSTLGEAQDFAPELPVLTRYKKDVIDAKRRAFEGERTSCRAKNEWWGDFSADARWGDGPERLAIGKFPGLADDQNETNSQTQSNSILGGKHCTLPQLCARVASLHFLRRNLDALETEVPSRFAKMQRAQGVDETHASEAHEVYENYDPTNPYVAKNTTVWFDGLLDGARQTLTSCQAKVADYVACKIVYWDLRDFFVDGLYRGGVKKGERAFSVVQRLEAALREVARRLPGGDGGLDTLDSSNHGPNAATEARDGVVHALLRATVQGYMWVMLDGGVGRVFDHDDAAALEEDLLDFKELFTAGGEGVSADTVQAVMKRAERLLMVMSLDTQTLCDAYLEQEKKQTFNLPNGELNSRAVAASPGGGGDVGELDDEGGFGASTLLRVLCHRSDRDASKFLKANMHLPKGDEGSVTAFLTGKGNSAAAYLAKKYEKYKK